MKCTICGSENTHYNKKYGVWQCEECEREFTPEEPPQRKLNVFFSYGHDENAVVVEALKKCIEKKTENRIKIWIDKSETKGGDDWRQKILNGILDSDCVLAFLSKYSVRIPGVCRDELAIAIGTKYGMIKSILLEEEKKVVPPADIAERIWFNMSDWKKYSGEEFDSYIETEAEKIISALYSPEIEQFQGDISTLRKKLLIRLTGEQSKFDLELAKVFVEREWLKKRVNSWLDDTNGSRILAVYGRPGAGKTAFCARFQHHSADVAAAISCDRQVNEFSNTDDIIRRLAFRLAMRLPDYRSMLLYMFDADESLPSNNEMLFRYLIAEPLGRLSIDGGRKHLVIVIDGLDELNSYVLPVFINKYKDSFAPWVRFLVTSRREASVTERLDCQYIDINECEKENYQDIRKYFVYMLAVELAGYGECEADAFINRLTEASEGVFLYAEQICPLISEDLNTGIPSLEKYEVPHGMSDLFEMTLERKFPNTDDNNIYNAEYNRFWRDPLGMICASPKPIPKKTLIKLCGWSDNDASCFFTVLAPLLKVGNEVKVFHNCFADWLDTTGSVYHSSSADGIKALAKACYASYKTDLTLMDRYELSYASYLLRNAGMNAEYNELTGDEKFTDEMSELGYTYEGEYNYESALFVFTDLAKIFEETYIKTRNSLYERLSAISLDDIGRMYLLMRDYVSATEYAEKALKISHKLTLTYPDDPELQSEYGRLLYEAGHIKRVSGDYSGALECYKKYIEIFSRIARMYREPKIMIDLGIALRKVINMNNAIEDYYDAYEYFEESLDMFYELAEREPDNLELQRALGLSLVVVADINQVMKDYDSALQYCEEGLNISRMLAEKNSDDPELQEEFCRALLMMCNIKQASKDYSGSLKHYEEYIRILRGFIEASPDNPSLRKHLGIVLSRLGNSKQALKDYSGAYECYEEYLQIFRSLSEAHPGDSRLQRELATALCRFGDTKQANDDYNGAYECYEEYLEILRLLSEAYPGDPGLQRDLGIALERVGEIKQAQNDYNGAYEYYEKSHKIYRTLVETHPDDPGIHSNFGRLFGRIGGIKKILNDYNGAIEFYEEKSAIFRKLSKAHPNELKIRENLISSLKDIGGLKEKLNNSRDALVYYEEALKIAYECTYRHPDNTEMQNELRILLSKVGVMKEELSDYTGALECYEECLRISRTFAETYPDNTELHNELCLLLSKVGRMKKESSDYIVALECYEECLRISRALAETHPDNIELQNDLTMALSGVGDVKQAQEDYIGALEYYEECLKISRTLVETYPDDFELQGDLSISLNDVGRAREALEDYVSALEVYEEDLKISRMLAETHPDDFDLQNYLNMVLSHIGDIKQAQGDYIGALEYYEECLKISRTLAETYPDAPELQSDLGETLEGIGGIKEALEDYGGALKYYKEALHIFTKLVSVYPQTAENADNKYKALSAIKRIEKKQQ